RRPPTPPTVPTVGLCQATPSPRSFERVPPSEQSITAKRSAKAIQSGWGKVPRPSLPSDHAFVVQFRARSSRHRLASAGRVEHVRSGEAIHFGSPEELLAFTRKVLRRSAGNRARADVVPTPGELRLRGEAQRAERGRDALERKREGVVP